MYTGPTTVLFFLHEFIVIANHAATHHAYH
eukprot:COSAG02_NODE_922_length_15907_cov_4.423303_9_plen_30_part_00